MPEEPVVVPPAVNDAKPTLRITLIIIALSIVGSLVWGWVRWQHWQKEWNRVGPIEPSGGLFFQPRLELNDVPLFRQADERWGKDKLGNTPASLAAEGCAVASAAMVLASYGVDTDPGRLNKLATEGGGYVGNGWLDWDKAAELTGNVARKVYEAEPSFRLIDENLRRRNPVIVRIRLESGGITHFVVIAGKEGYDYLVRDPGAGASKGLYPLKEFGSKIEALRFYDKVGRK